MIVYHNFSLLPYNTFQLDIKTDSFIEFNSAEELKNILVSPLLLSSPNLMVIGRGSNLLFLDDFKGTILHSGIKFIKKIGENSEFVFLEVGSGIIWDDFVQFCVENGYQGIENLSGIPGEVGAAAVQNIGAYGVEIQEMIEKVNVVEIHSAKIHEFSNAECQYGYRKSIFKKELKGKLVVTSVIFRLNKKSAYKLDYEGLEKEVHTKGEINLKNIRQAILDIRSRKLPDYKKFGNAGSFFVNPIISKENFQKLQKNYPNIPHYTISEKEEKISAAWLIEQCGWKGKQIGQVKIHEYQPLILINCGNASGKEIAQIANQIQASVKDKFQIELQPEVNYIYS